MKFPFSSAILSTFIHATEDESKVLKALKTFLPEDVKIQQRKSKGHYGNPIIVLDATLERRKLLRQLWNEITTRMDTDDLERINQIVPERLDDERCLYLRFDKQQAYAGKLVLTDSGDVIHIKLKVAAYPAKREVAVRLVREFLQMR